MMSTTRVDILLESAAPAMTAAQLIEMSNQALKPGGLVAGAYYKGYLGDLTAIGRWNGLQLRFVVWVPEGDKFKLKGARHILESGIGDAFAPFEKVEVEKERQISDFDLNTVR